MPETKDLILRKAIQSDWMAMYRNIWRHPESAKYMLWDVTTSEADAISRMERTIRFQSEHPFHWTVVEKKSGQAIGWAGLRQVDDVTCEETGIALGPDFTGKGYGTQLLNALTDFARDQLGAKRFLACCRSQNEASRRLQRACGFRFTHREAMTDPRNDEPYILEYYEKDL
ncbi:MAG: GNAT family N-acetyltransferase [Oscillospiraceae bacterium]|nr:GNAT family N-acetyltransferase [Oscillospiraceae bacterium]MBR2890166.1 GNAT family N-acetyltransferase [Oscillospiraceae bacterium]